MSGPHEGTRINNRNVKGISVKTTFLTGVVTTLRDVPLSTFRLV